MDPASSWEQGRNKQHQEKTRQEWVRTLELLRSENRKNGVSMMLVLGARSEAGSQTAVIICVIARVDLHGRLLSNVKRIEEEGNIFPALLCRSGKNIFGAMVSPD